MHVGVADQRIEHQAADKLRDIAVTAFGSDNVRDIYIAGSVVLPGGIDPEDLGKVFDVNRSSVRKTIVSVGLALVSECSAARLLLIRCGRYRQPILDLESGHPPELAFVRGHDGEFEG